MPKKFKPITAHGQAVSDGMQRAMRDKPKQWEAMNRRKSATQIKRLSELSVEAREEEIRKRVIGFREFQDDKPRRDDWHRNGRLASESLKKGDKVHLITVPIPITIIEELEYKLITGFVRGYEYRTVELLCMMFGHDQLRKWKLRNDIVFQKDEFSVSKFTKEQLVSYQTPKCEYVYEEANHVHQFDHSLCLSKEDLYFFIAKLATLFCIDSERIKRSIKIDEDSEDFIVVIETKSFTSAQAMNRDGWWNKIQAKANGAQASKIESRSVVYILIEHNQSSVVLYAPEKENLIAVGVALYDATDDGPGFKKHQKYFENPVFQDVIPFPNVESYGKLHLDRPIETTALEVYKVSQPYLSLI